MKVICILPFLLLGCGNGYELDNQMERLDQSSTAVAVAGAPSPVPVRTPVITPLPVSVPVAVPTPVVTPILTPAPILVAPIPAPIPATFVKLCNISNGIGSQTCTSQNTCSPCLATSCNPEFTPSGAACILNIHLVQAVGNHVSNCWRDGKIICAEKVTPNGYIGLPQNGGGNSQTVFNFSVKYSNADTINLNAAHIILGGPGSIGCTKSVSGTGKTERTVTISGCQNNGALTFSVAANSAVNLYGQSLAFGPSTSVLIAHHTTPTAFIEAFDKTYMGKNTLQLYDLYLPADWESRRNIPALIWIHGGGWSGGTRKSDIEFLKAVAALGIVVLSVDYTLAPTLSLAGYPNATAPAVPYTAGPEDIKIFVSELNRVANVINVDTSKISIAGSSAGGHLALNQATRPDNIYNFNCVISMAGPTNLTREYVNYPATNFIIKNTFGGSLDILKSMSPSSNAASFKGNKLLILHQVQDNLVPIDQAFDFVSKIKLYKPNTDLTVNYYNDTNQFPLLNPKPEELNHVNITQAPHPVLGFIQTRCL